MAVAGAADRRRVALLLSAAADGKPGATSAFMSPAEGTGALPNLTVPRQIAGLSVYRDLHAFYAAKDQLFPERTSGLIFFENMMGIFFSGRDLTEEVFAETCPEVRLVVAAQAYDKAVGTPRVQIPAFALVVRTRHPDEFARVAEEAWQKAVGLTTVTRGQQAEPGLIIDRETYQGIRFSVATNAPGKNDDKAHLPSRFNYSPSPGAGGRLLRARLDRGTDPRPDRRLEQGVEGAGEAPGGNAHAGLDRRRAARGRRSGPTEKPW